MAADIHGLYQQVSSMLSLMYGAVAQVEALAVAVHKEAQVAAVATQCMKLM